MKDGMRISLMCCLALHEGGDVIAPKQHQDEMGWDIFCTI